MKTHAVSLSPTSSVVFSLFAIATILWSGLSPHPARAATPIRYIYSTEPGNNSYTLATAADFEGGAQVVANSTTTYHSAPQALRLKYLAGVARNIVGIRFINANWTPATFDLTTHKFGGALEFWVNPKATPIVPSFSIGLVSDNGTVVETRLPLSNFLQPGDYADKWTFISIPFWRFSDTGFTYNSQTQQTSPAPFDWTKVRGLNFSCDTTSAAYYDPSVDDIQFTSFIDPLTISGNHFATSNGTTTRFWGINLVAMYPTHAESQGIAANLAAREINMVRLHHNLRKSLDWNTVSGIPALVDYVNDTRTPHTEAWDRFDYLNAQLRAQGIYLLLSQHSSRRYLAGDVDIMTTDATDRTNWMNAMNALNSMSGNLDLFKMLPVIDERCARLMEEFTQRLITHVNPYTARSYGSDPQVIYLETLNEHSCEYAIVAGNKFQSTTYPAVSYWTTVLQSKWDAYTAANGVTPCDIYAPSTTAQKLARGDFLRGLDQAFANRMKTSVRSLGSQVPMTYSNLWRGEAFQKLQESLSDVVEDHNYCDPLVARSFDDVFNPLSRSTPTGKPYVIGELNQVDSGSSIPANAPYRTMLPLAASAYGGFNNWSGVTWFAWAHGDKMIGNDGWSIWEERRPAVDGDMIGQIESDGMLLDHLRTTGLIFKRGLAAPSTGPLTLWADDPLGTSGYTSLIAPKYQFQVGWQNIHSIKRAFGPVPPSQPTATWMTTPPTNPLLSDTNEIRKDTTRQQLTLSASQAEAFSGKLDASAPAGLTRLGGLTGSGSATVIVVSEDGLPLSTSQNLVISRTQLDSANNEVANPTTTLTQIKAPAGGSVWHILRTRPRGETGYEALTMSNGVLTLPNDGWHEAELAYAPAGSLPARQSLAHVGDPLRPIFDDAFRIAGVFGAPTGFSQNAQQVIDPSTTFAPAEGTKSMRLKFTAGTNPSVIGINFTNSAAQATTLDFTSWRTTAGLRLWVYTKRVVSSFSVELACDNAGQLVEVRVPLSNYLQASDYGNKWVQVTVPFADFPSANGAGTPFLWNQVKGVGLYCSMTNEAYYDPYVDDVRVVRTTAP
jgi:hypothetical protein